MFGRNKFAALVAEFLGVATLVLTILAISKSGVGFSVFLALGVGVGLATLIMAFGSMGHFNPAITLGLLTGRKISLTDAIGYIAAQLLGAVAARTLYEYLAEQPLRSLSNSEFEPNILIAEALGALVFSLGVAAAVYKARVGSDWAALAGLALFLGVIVASIASNGLINPAIALGIQSWSVEYVAGPVIGAVVGVNLYSFLFATPGDKVASKKRDKGAAADRRFKFARPKLGRKK